MWQMAFTMLTDIALPGIDLQYLSRDNKELSVLRHGTLNYDFPSQGIAEKSIRRNFRPVLPAGHAAAYKHTEPRF